MSIRKLYTLTLTKILKRANIKSGEWNRRERDEYFGKAICGLEKDKESSKTLTLTLLSRWELIKKP